MRIVLIFLAAFLFLTDASAETDFAVAPPEQIITESQYTKALKRDPWEKDRWNYIDPKTGLRNGGFIKKDRWEPYDRWNIYDSKGYPSGVLKRDRYDSEQWNYSGKTSTYGIGVYNDGTGGD